MQTQCSSIHPFSVTHLYGLAETQVSSIKMWGFGQNSQTQLKNAESGDPEVQLSPCLIDGSHMSAPVQKIAKSSERFTPMENKETFSFSIHFYLPVLLHCPFHYAPLSCRFWSHEHQHQHMASDGIAWPRIMRSQFQRRRSSIFLWPK